MADAEIKALLNHIKDIGERTEKKLDEHIVRDEQISKDFILPLWNSYQQRKGALAASVAFYGGLSAGVSLLISWMKH